MNLLKYICLPGLLASGDIQTVSAVESKTDKNPNILVILIDDAGYNDFGFMGSKEMQTPNIDALTSEGVVFTDAHVAATVSSPSRACLITGLIPAVELAKEAKINVFIYFPPHQYSSNLATMGNGAPIQMLRYEKRFKQALLPDKITLANGFELSIPTEWKVLQRGEK